MIVYKVMKREGTYLVSLSDPNLKFNDPAPGDVLLASPFPGFWVAPSKKYCLTHYASGEGEKGGENEVILRMYIDRQDIAKGEITDREPELSVTSARLLWVDEIPD